MPEKPWWDGLERRVTAALRIATDATRSLLGNVKPSWVPGRDERFRARLERAVAHLPAVQDHLGSGQLELRVNVFEGFGKPTLVNFDIVFVDPEQEVSADSVLVQDLLDRATELFWDNPEMAPVAARGRILVSRPLEDGPKKGEPPGHQSLRRGEELVMDLETLGFADEIARAADLYDRFGPPRFDPAWRP